MTTTAKILALLLESPHPLSSAAVSFRLGIKPRQVRDAMNLLLTTKRIYVVGKKHICGGQANMYRHGPAPSVSVPSLMAGWIEAARNHQERRA